MSDKNKQPGDDNLDVLSTAAKTGSLSQDQFMALLSLMMAKEKRLIEKEAELERVRIERDKQEKLNSEQYTIAKIETQKACKHLKGGKTRQRGQQRDPNVFAHTFTDGSVVIKCNSCGARWMPKDTSEYLHRNGMAIPNWTGIGWREAVEMAEDSSNKPSASEIFQRTTNQVEAPKAQKIITTPNFQI